MKTEEAIVDAYRTASAGDPEALDFLVKFHVWAHLIDDMVDEPGNGDRAFEVAVLAVELFQLPYYLRNFRALGPLILSVAEQWRWSNRVPGTPIGEALRICGNQVPMAVAGIQGGWPLQRRLSEALWPIVEGSQLCPTPK